jgi:hypothetical protein
VILTEEDPALTERMLLGAMLEGSEGNWETSDANSEASLE